MARTGKQDRITPDRRFGMLTVETDTGQRFGKLKILYPTDKRMDKGSEVWHAVCDCGNECDVSARRLMQGKTRSCGCLSNPPLKDYIGKTFGRWTVIEYAGTARDRGFAGTMNYQHYRFQRECECELFGQYRYRHLCVL